MNEAPGERWIPGVGPEDGTVDVAARSLLNRLSGSAGPPAKPATATSG